MASSKVLLVLGAGANIGASVARVFASRGYKVAVTSRGNIELDKSYLAIKADLSQPEKVKDVFATVKQEYGAAPSVVVYNAAHAHQTPSDPLSLSQSELENDFAVNLTSAYLSAQEAVHGFETLPADLAKSFIYTGNGLNTKPLPVLTSLGLGKAAMAHVLEAAVLAHKDNKQTFYYCDERQANGDYAYAAISGPGHAERYWELSQDKDQHEVVHTFVSGKGYTKFL